MIQRISWIFALTVTSVLAQQGDRLWIGNAAGVGQPGQIAPGSLAQYSITFEKFPPLLSFETPALTLRRGSGPEIPLDIQDGTPFSGKIYIPEDTATGPATITLKSDVWRLSVDVEIAASAAALYSVDFSRVLNAQIGPTASPVQLTRPVRPGDIVTLWGTGLGNAAAADVEASIGQQPLQVLYAGRSSQYRGLDQYNIAIPTGAQLPDTCYARLDLKIRSAATPIGYLPTTNAATGPCRHPLNLTPAQLTALDQGGQIPVAAFSVATYISPAAQDEQVDFSRVQRHEDASASISNMPASIIALSSAFTYPEPTGQCTILASGGGQAFLGGGGQPPEPPPSLGDKLRLEGPAQSWDLTRPPPERWFDNSTYTANLPLSEPARYFDQLPASVWTPGKYTFSGPGDASLEAFRIDTDIPGPIRFRNPETLRSIDRTRDLMLAWDTEGMKPAESLDIRVISRSDTNPIFLICSVRALDGTLTIPSTLLQQLPAAEVNAQRTPALWLRYLRPSTVLQLPRRNADPVPAFIDWSSYAIIPVALR